MENIINLIINSAKKEINKIKNTYHLQIEGKTFKNGSKLWKIYILMS